VSEAGKVFGSVGVVGAGTMGNGIAHVFARSGFEVVLCEVNRAALDRGLATIRTNLDREAAKGKVDPAEVSGMLARVKPVGELAELQGCSLVVEAATEKLGVKQEILKKLDALLGP
jgi:3-hydroxybutyryl-CoA dehydrogenase